MTSGNINFSQPMRLQDFNQLKDRSVTRFSLLLFTRNFFSAHTYQDFKKIPDLSVNEESAVQVRSSDPILKQLSVVSNLIEEYYQDQAC